MSHFIAARFDDIFHHNFFRHFLHNELSSYFLFVNWEQRLSICALLLAMRLSNDKSFTFHFKESSSKWLYRRDSHIDIRYDDAFDSLSLIEYSVSILESKKTTHRTALAQIRQLHAIFANQSMHYRIEFITNSSLFENLKIIRKDESNEKIFVELKDFHCSYDSKTIVLKHQQQVMQFTHRTIFNYKVQWDYLYTVVRANFVEEILDVLFVSRDLISFCWWNVLTANSDESILEWSINHAVAAEVFFIHSSDSKQQIVEMTIIIQKYESVTLISVSFSLLSDADWGDSTSFKLLNQISDKISIFSSFLNDSAQDDFTLFELLSDSLDEMSNSRDMIYQMMTYQTLMQIYRK